MSIIPSPEQARDLRTLFAQHPIVGRAVAALCAFAADLHVRDAATLLPMWAHFAELSEREVAAVLARFVPLPADRCTRCGAAIRYVTDGADPGWWTHTDIAQLLSDDSQRPHPPMPNHGGER